LDATGWVAIAGIAGTLLAPLFGERMRRKSVRTEQLAAQRLVVYADLLTATARIVDNANEWSALPLADMKETEAGELDRLGGRVRVVASKAVYEDFKKLSSTTQKFNRFLFLEVRPHHQRIRAEGKVDDERSIQQRMRLGDIAHKIGESHQELEKKIREEMKS
jgi:hypothetical protein